MSKDASKTLPDVTPCDSPIEDIFYAEAQKHFACEIQRQVECPTAKGNFRLDFMAVAGTRRIGIECDGREFHDPMADGIRDKAIIKAGLAERIYRLSGGCIFHSLHHLLDMIRLRERRLFTRAGHDRIWALCRGLFEDRVDRSWNGFEMRAQRRFWIHDKDDDGELIADETKCPVLIEWTGAGLNAPDRDPTNQPPSSWMLYPEE